jgi:hypothetical protein
MPPATRAPRSIAEKLLAATIVLSVLLWLTSFAAVTVDPAGRAWKWLAMAAIIVLFGAAIASWFTIGRRRT